MFKHYRNVTLSVLATALMGLLMLLLAACSGNPSSLASVSSDSLANAQVSTNASHSSYKFRTINDKADPTFNQLLGINNSSKIVGYFGGGTVVNGTLHPNKGYRIVPPYNQNNYSNENFPGSVQTQVIAVNNYGYTAGFWVDGNGNNFGFIKWNGVYTSYRDPHTTGTVNQLLGLNDNGIAVGFYTDSKGINHGYELNSRNGHFKEIVPPGATNVTVAGINNNNDVVGFFTAGNGSTVSFLLRNNRFSEFDFPHSTNTTALGVNNSDQIVGVYVDGANKMHGFLLSSPLNHAKWQSIDDPNGIGTTTINGLNDKGQLVGFYVDGAGNTDGFLAQ